MYRIAHLVRSLASVGISSFSSVYGERPLLWSFSASMLFHAVVLATSLLVFQTHSRPPLPLNVQLVNPFTEEPSTPPQESAPAPVQRWVTPATGSATGKSTAARPQTPSIASGNESRSSGESQPGGESEDMSVAESETSSTGVGISSGSGGGKSGAGGTSSTGKSSATGGTSGRPGGPPGTGGKTVAEGIATPSASTVIPEPPEHRYRVYGSYFAEVDHYVIEGMNIPATDLCVAGDQLSTLGPITITQVKTDRSKCWVRTRGDEEREFCPPSARSQIVAFKGHLVTPVSYSVNTCREYDTSHCRIRGAGTDREREVCKRLNFKYEGVWASDTMFDYKCTKSEVVTHRHPLQYNIRYLVDVHRGDSTRSKEIHRVTQSIPQCNKNESSTTAPEPTQQLTRRRQVYSNSFVRGIISRDSRCGDTRVQALTSFRR